MNLNLARKWRSKTFDEVVGQELNVRILKNSLYLNYLFPVYLFSGQRGCGKTTMARIFAAALNCQDLESFQKQPKNYLIPCLTCISCTLMRQGTHPDFIEIDAASHTGVDNVRSIIDTATFMPVVGTKKIYLIDEAHMLSKAAFNAFLKILEEPPAQVHFILATTEVQKIVDTVRSRSFQLFFGPLPLAALLRHLEEICSQENILYEQDGLRLIIQESDGSARDALNLLEQTRFGANKITRQAVQEVLGSPDEQTVLSCMKHILQGNSQNAIALAREVLLAKTTPLLLWRSFVYIVQELLSVHCNLEPQKFNHLKSLLYEVSQYSSLQQCAQLLTILAHYEQFMIKTSAAHAFVELLIIQLSSSEEKTISSSSSRLIQKSDDFSTQSSTSQSTLTNKIPDRQIAPAESKENSPDAATIWNTILTDINNLDDPLISSIFQHVHKHTWNESNRVMTLFFAKEFTFFNDLLENTKTIWHPIVQKIIGAPLQVILQFTEGSASSHMQEKTAPIQEKPVTSHKSPSYTSTYKKNNQITKSITVKSIEPLIDVSDPQKWPRAHQLTAKFPGTVTLVAEHQVDTLDKDIKE